MEHKTIRYKAIKNEEIANAIIELASPMLKASGDSIEVIEALMEIAVKSWNLSLFKPSDNNYDKEIERVLPQKLDNDKRSLFKNFIKYMIREKQNRYPEFLKGIKTYTCKIEAGKISLLVEALPVKPAV